MAAHHTLKETRREEAHVRLPAKCRLSRNLLGFTRRLLAALQIVVRRDFPPYRFNCLWACSFHFQFHDLRLMVKMVVSKYYPSFAASIFANIRSAFRFAARNSTTTFFIGETHTNNE